MKTTTRRASRRDPVARASDPIANTLAFMRLLWALDHGLRSISKRMQKHLGVTAPQRLAIRLIGRHGAAVRPSELAELLHLDRGTLSGILERLVAQDLLHRTPHPDDRRSHLLGLTAAGRKFDRRMHGSVEDCIQRALDDLPAAKIKAAREVLERIVREVEAER